MMTAKGMYFRRSACEAPPHPSAQAVSKQAHGVVHLHTQQRWAFHGLLTMVSYHTLLKP